MNVNFRRYLYGVLSVYGLCFFGVAGSFAQTMGVQLAWDPPTHSLGGGPLVGLAGYVLRYGEESEGLTKALDVGLQAMAAVRGLEFGSVYVFAVQAYTDLGAVSQLSEPLCFRTPDATAVAVGPQSLTVVPAASASFTVVTTGVSPSRYQWRRNGVPIAGATAQTYVLRVATVVDDGAIFDVVVVSPSGLVTSGGAVLRLASAPADLPVGDADADGIPDAWEVMIFGDVDAGGEGDSDGDGVSDVAEYVAGTSAADAASYALLGIDGGVGSARLRFHAIAAWGPGYEGLERYYRVEFRRDLRMGGWAVVPGYEAVVATNQTVSVGVSGAPGFFRTLVWLE